MYTNVVHSTDRLMQGSKKASKMLFLYMCKNAYIPPGVHEIICLCNKSMQYLFA